MELEKTNANKRMGIQKKYIFVLKKKKNMTAMLLLWDST